MPKITMIRPEKWRNKAKSITIFIDDKEVGNIGLEKKLHFDVSPGKHKVLIKNKWGAESYPLEVDLSDNVDKDILMTNSRYAFLFVLIISSALTIIYSYMRNFFNIVPNSFNDTLALLFIYLLIFFLLFRNNYLKLKEVLIYKEGIKDAALVDL